MKNFNFINIPQGSGVYLISCIKNGKKYIGESNNLCFALGTHYKELNDGKHRSKELQSDWTLYGPESFTFGLLDQNEINLYETKRELFVREAQKEPGFYTEKGKLRAKSKNTAIPRRAVEINGILYPSLSEAAKTYQMTPTRLHRKLKKGEKLGPPPLNEGGTRTIRLAKGNYTSSNAQSQKIKVDGVVYNSINEAARVLGCTVYKVRYRLYSDKYDTWQKID